MRLYVLESAVWMQFILKSPDVASLVEDELLAWLGAAIVRMHEELRLVVLKAAILMEAENECWIRYWRS